MRNGAQMSLTAQSRVVVVGGTSGIGLAVAHAVSKRGAAVVIGSRSAKSVDKALGELPGARGTQVDVTDPASLNSFFAEAGEFDHLVYTAGDDIVRAPIADYSPEKAHAFFEVRVFRAFDTVRAALSTLRPTGSITLTSGAGAYLGGPGRLLSAAVGGSLISAGQSLAAELAPIRVNVIVPGIVRTPLYASMPQQAREEMFTHASSHTLVGRAAEPEEIAESYVHLMEADYVTGTVSLVEGGLLRT
ncbi:SDR family oxidoreductase [Nocardia farcinica]|nr:SDR family oxidoreductase [Nocardia farcinica]MCZ9328974.1 SDR family oxidoreductase [Nocardia farcinica]